MFNANQISLRISEIKAHRFSVEDFERWFRAESKNFHSWASEDLSKAIFEVESVLSEYHLAELRDDVAVKELANAIRPFERIAVPASPHVQPNKAKLMPVLLESLQGAVSSYFSEQVYGAP